MTYINAQAVKVQRSSVSGKSGSEGVDVWAKTCQHAKEGKKKKRG